MNQFDSLLSAEVAEQVHRPWLVLLPSRRVVSQGRPVKCVATLAAVNLRGSAERLDGFLFLRAGKETVRIVIIPTLEVAEA